MDDETGENCTEDDYTDVAPLAGRLVIFRSRTVLHEVRPSYAKRTALSLWMLRSAASPIKAMRPDDEELRATANDIHPR